MTDRTIAMVDGFSCRRLSVCGFINWEGEFLVKALENSGEPMPDRNLEFYKHYN